MSKPIQLSALIDPQLREDFDIACSKRRISYKRGIEEALNMWLDASAAPSAVAERTRKVNEALRLLDSALADAREAIQPTTEAGKEGEVRTGPEPGLIRRTC